MAHSSKQKKPALKLLHEASPYCTVVFKLRKPHGTVTEHKADCGLNLDISGLKEDLSQTFGPVAEQRWTYNGEVLEDNRQLSDYGIEEQRTRHRTVTIIVEQGIVQQG